MDQNHHSSPWPTTIAVMLATLMVILDMTIVNVSLPHMAGALGATSDQITWVLTSYIVAEGVTIPLSGFLARWFGRRRVILTSIIGFIVMSALCGQATSLVAMVIFRILQGVFGAPVIPLSQATLIDSFPPAQRGRAMAIFGIGVLLGPALGPTLGGYITEHMSWRWVFYINVPMGILNLLLAIPALKETERVHESLDWLGALLMAMGIGSLQFVLDRGNQENWFDSDIIIFMTLLMLAALSAFIIRSWNRQDSVLKLSLLRDRNLATGSFLIMAFGLGLFGTVVLQPILLQDLLGYPPSTTGLMMGPRALCNAFTMALAVPLMPKIGTRPMIAAGMLIMSAGSYLMSRYNLEISPFWAIVPGMVQGVGMGLVFVPLATIAFETIAPHDNDQAATIFNLARTIGSSIGISIVTTILSRNTQINWNRLGGHIMEYSPAMNAWLNAHGMTPDHPLAPNLLAMELARQATMVAFINDFWFISIAILLLIPLVLLMKSTGKTLDLSALH